MQITEQFLNKVELEYLKLLIAGLKNGTIKPQETQSMSQRFISFLPFTSLEDIEVKIKQLAQHYPIFDPLHTNVLRYEKEQNDIVHLSDIRRLLQTMHQQEPLHLATLQQKMQQK